VSDASSIPAVLHISRAALSSVPQARILTRSSFSHQVPLMPLHVFGMATNDLSRQLIEVLFDDLLCFAGVDFGQISDDPADAGLDEAFV